MDAILQAPPLRIESSEGLQRLQLSLDENLMAMEAMSINIKVNCFFSGFILCLRNWTQKAEDSGS